MLYPDNLHDEHDDYPLLPENRKIKPSMLSTYQRKLAEEYEINMKANSNTPKLICSLYDKVSIFSLKKKSHLIYFIIGKICPPCETFTAGSKIWNEIKKSPSGSLIYTILLA